MTNRIIEFVEASFSGNFHPKALDCLKELRLGCEREEEKDTFNECLKKLKEKFEGHRVHHPFWELCVKNGIVALGEEKTEENDEALDLLDIL